MLKLLLANILIILHCMPVYAVDKLAMREREIEQAAQEYESVMIKQVLSQVYESIPVNSVAGGGDGERIFRDLLLSEYSKEISKTGAIGISKSLIKDLKKKDAEYQKLLNEVNHGKSH